MSKNHYKKFAVRGAALFFSALFIGVVAIGCGSPSPSVVAEKFYEASAKGDMEALGKYATPETIASVGPMMSKAQPMIAGFGKAKAVSQEVNGDEAVVVIKFENHNENEEVNLKKVDGKWRVHFTLSSGSGSGK